jgi:hypothetical protein
MQALLDQLNNVGTDVEYVKLDSLTDGEYTVVLVKAMLCPQTEPSRRKQWRSIRMLVSDGTKQFGFFLPLPYHDLMTDDVITRINEDGRITVTKNDNKLLWNTHHKQ